MLNARELEEQLSAALSQAICVAVATEHDPVPDLFEMERHKFQSLSNERAQQSWCAGRIALKTLLRQAEHSPDTSLLAFPNPHYSLSHSRGTAIAVSSPAANGIGVDLEFDRPINAGIRKFYLNEEETAQTSQLTLEQDDLLRLWTVKEAVFKSDLNNKDQLLARYSLNSLNAISGSARRAGYKFSYSSVRLAGGWISVAIAMP